jgi:hypothetical protein
MKRLNNKLSYTLYLVLVAVLSSCESEPKQKIEQSKSNAETYETKARYKDIEIVKVRDCEYVLWHNSYGSDMEHYEGCENPKHCN